MTQHVFGATALAFAAITALVVIRDALRTHAWTDGPSFIRTLKTLSSDTRDRMGLVLVSLVAAAVFLWPRPAPPPVSSVDGAYSNPCCAPIRLRNGFLIAGRNRVPFTLSRMKSGLAALPPVSVNVDPDNRVSPHRENEPGMIVFDEDGRGFTLADPGGRRFYEFRRLP